MSQKEKLISYMQSNPLPTDISFDDFKKYLEYYGFELKRTDGSHNMFVHNKSGLMYTVPTLNGRNVKTIYLKKANEIIKQMEE